MVKYKVDVSAWLVLMERSIVLESCSGIFSFVFLDLFFFLIAHRIFIIYICYRILHRRHRCTTSTTAITAIHSLRTRFTVSAPKTRNSQRSRSMLLEAWCLGGVGVSSLNSWWATRVALFICSLWVGGGGLCAWRVVTRG